VVREVTDDKSLPKDRRKELQVEHAPHSSPRAKQLKIADKIANISDIVASPPAYVDVKCSRRSLGSLVEDEMRQSLRPGCR
jgi:hypothetical protein